MFATTHPVVNTNIGFVQKIGKKAFSGGLDTSSDLAKHLTEHLRKSGYIARAGRITEVMGIYDNGHRDDSPRSGG